MELVLHSQSAELLTSFVKKPSHCLLISAPTGSGKLFVAQKVTSKLLGVSDTRIYEHPYFLHKAPTNSSIGIETIRDLKGFMSLKTTGDQEVRRVVILEGAGLMTREAQNALLKLLEEPPRDSVIILTADQPRELLPTILSRARHIQLKRPTKLAVMSYFGQNHSTDLVNKAYYMSEGRVGLMWALLAESEAHPLVDSIKKAKELLQKPIYERLLQVNELSNGDLSMLLDAFYSVAHAALYAALEKDNEVAVKQWYARCKAIYNVERQLKHKPQAKLLLTNLLINL